MKSENLIHTSKGEVLLLGYHTWGNSGDDAILISLVKILDNFKSNLIVNIYSRNEYIQKNFGSYKIVSVRFIKSLKELFFTILRVKKMVIIGGDYLYDYGSLRHILKVFLVFSMLVLLKIITFKDLLIINNGFRARTLFGAILIKNLLRFAKCISVRDKASYNLLSRILSKPVIQGFDTAVQLYNDIVVNNFYLSKSNSVKKIGISITPVFTNLFSNPSKDEDLANAIANNIVKILKNFEKLEIYLLNLFNNPKKGDLVIIKKIIDRLPNNIRNKIKIISYDGDIQKILSLISELDFIICCKYHSIIFSYILSKPMVIINYHPKNIALAQELKLPNKAIISLENIMSTDDSFVSTLNEVLKNPSSFYAKLPISEAIKRAYEGVHKCQI